MTFLFAILLAAHLLSVNLSMVGPLVSLWLKGRTVRIGDAAACDLGRRMAIWSQVTLLVGMLLGLAMVGLFMLQGERRFLEALGAMPNSRVFYGALELGFFYLCMVPYSLTWRFAQGKHRYWHHLLAILATTNMIYHFPPLFIVLSKTMNTTPIQDLAMADFRSLVFSAEVLARWAHHFLAAVALAGCALMLLSKSSANQYDKSDSATGSKMYTVAGARIALLATLLQVPVGVWVLLKVPAAWRNNFLGEDLLTTALFALSILAAFGLLHFLVSISLGDSSRGKVLGAVAMLVVTVVLMSTALTLVSRPLKHGPAAAVQTSLGQTIWNPRWT